MKLLIGFIIFSVAAIGFLSFANAEEVELPFEPQGMDCEESETLTTLTYGCVWIAQKPFGIKVIQEGLDEYDIKTLKEIDYWKKQGLWVQPPEEDWRNPGNPIEDKKEQTTLDILTERVCEGERASDKELCNHLNQLSICEQGVTETESEPISTYRKFFVSDGVISDKGFDLQDNQFLKDVYLKIEECYAIWQVLQPTVLGEQYLNFVRQIDDYQPYHADMATEHLGHPASRYLGGMIAMSQQTAQSTICYNSAYSEAFKKQQGCEKLYDGMYKNRKGMTVFEQRLMGSDPMTEYLKYKIAEAEGKPYYPNQPLKSITITGMGSWVNNSTTWEFQIPNRD